MTLRSLVRALASTPWWRWTIPLALLVINLGVFAYYQASFAGQVGQMQNLLDAEMQELGRVSSQRKQLADLVASAAAGREGIDALYTERFLHRVEPADGNDS